jgi:AcrR family transcriptional regulator
MLDSAVVLLRERGAAGVTIDAVLAHSGAPRGSVYHHFPDGRSELVLAAAGQAGDHIAAVLDRAVRDTDPATALERFVRFWQQALSTTEFTAGCPIVAVAVDGPQHTSGAADLVRDVFTRWQDNLSQLLIAHHHPPERARRLATLAISAVEGAIILCRAHRHTAPLDDVLTELAPLLRAPHAGDLRSEGAARP